MGYVVHYSLYDCSNLFVCKTSSQYMNFIASMEDSFEEWFKVTGITVLCRHCESLDSTVTAWYNGLVS